MANSVTPKLSLPSAEQALPGRDEAMVLTEPHLLFGHALRGPYPQGTKQALFGLGCFWGAERCFWQQPGVCLTAVGYAAGLTPNPTYREVCSGMTGHNEVVRVVYWPEQVSYQQLLALFWQSHDPSQGMRQGNDVGTQYRSGIYCFDDEQRALAEASRDCFQEALTAAGRGVITTEILPAPIFYFAETYHQQYLARNPDGYCGLGGCGVAYPLAER